jgi:hypothetical protein
MNSISSQAEEAQGGGSELSFEQLLGQLLPKVIDGFVSLNGVERLSAGASQETYCIEVTLESGPEKLAMRRASGGEEGEITAQHPGLAVGVADANRSSIQCARTRDTSRA